MLVFQTRLGISTQLFLTRREEQKVALVLNMLRPWRSARFQWNRAQHQDKRDRHTGHLLALQFRGFVILGVTSEAGKVTVICGAARQPADPNMCLVLSRCPFVKTSGLIADKSIFVFQTSRNVLNIGRKLFLTGRNERRTVLILGVLRPCAVSMESETKSRRAESLRWTFACLATSRLRDPGSRFRGG